MTRKNCVLVLTALAAAFLVTPARAQNEWVGSIMAGYSSIQEEEAPGGSIGGFGNGFYLLTPALGVGAEVGIFGFGSDGDSIIAVDPDITLAGIFDGKQSFSAYQVTAQLRFGKPYGKFRPYAIGGGGAYVIRNSRSGTWTIIDLENQNDPAFQFDVSDEVNSQTEFGFNLGAGLVFGKESSSVAFALEGRWNVVPNGQQVLAEREKTLNFLNIMAGLSFR